MTLKDQSSLIMINGYLGVYKLQSNFKCAFILNVMYCIGSKAASLSRRKKPSVLQLLRGAVAFFQSNRWGDGAGGTNGEWNGLDHFLLVGHLVESE